MQKQWSVRANVDGVGAARRKAESAFVEAGLSGAERQVLVLLVSELVTNAIVHARPPVRLSIDISDDRTRIAVSDAVNRVPHLRRAETGAVSGRGLALVEELSTHWGTTIGRHGKEVWLELERTPSDRRQLAATSVA